jgi:hypothetical protein
MRSGQAIALALMPLVPRPQIILWLLDAVSRGSDQPRPCGC